MKASITITDTIGIIGVVLIVIVFVTQILPTLLSTIIEIFSKSSAENVARQLSNLITVSGSATYKAEINYTLKVEAPYTYTSTKEVVYKISIDSRTIKVLPKFGVNYAEKSSSTQYFAVNLPDGEYVDVNSFLIKKNFLDGESKYVFDAKKE